MGVGGAWAAACGAADVACGATVAAACDGDRRCWRRGHAGCRGGRCRGGSSMRWSLAVDDMIRTPSYGSQSFAVGSNSGRKLARTSVGADDGGAYGRRSPSCLRRCGAFRPRLTRVVPRAPGENLALRERAAVTISSSPSWRRRFGALGLCGATVSRRMCNMGVWSGEVDVGAAAPDGGGRRGSGLDLPRYDGSTR